MESFTTTQCRTLAEKARGLAHLSWEEARQVDFREGLGRIQQAMQAEDWGTAATMARRYALARYMDLEWYREDIEAMVKAADRAGVTLPANNPTVEWYFQLALLASLASKLAFNLQQLVEQKEGLGAA